jgi:hypothetical protein
VPAGLTGQAVAPVTESQLVELANAVVIRV